VGGAKKKPFLTAATCARVLFLVNQGWRDNDSAFVLYRSTTLVRAYRALDAQFEDEATAQLRLAEILQRPQPALPVDASANSQKKGRAQP